MLDTGCAAIRIKMLRSVTIPSRSVSQRRRISRNELDEIGLPRGARLFEQAGDMRPDRRVGDAERGGDLRNAANLDDRQQYAKLGRRQLERAADGLRRGRYP